MGINEVFSLETHEAFLKLPWETAATYGGTSFKVIGPNTVEVLDQKYHYEMRSNNSVKNVIRNIATKIGYPTTMELYNGKFKPYMIRYKNPTIKLSMKNKWFLLLIPAVIFLACQSDKEKYYYFDKYQSMDVGDGKETFIYKSKNSSYYDTILVHSDIVKFKENYSHMIVLQKPNKKLMLKRIKSGLETLYKYHSENDSVVLHLPHMQTTVEINRQYKKDLDSILQLTQDSVKTYQIKANQIFENESFYRKIYNNPLNYYIIDKKQDSIYGPLSKEEFNTIQQKKGIELEFKK